MNGYTDGNAFSEIMTIFGVVVSFNLMLYSLDRYLPGWRIAIKEIFKRRSSK